MYLPKFSRAKDQGWTKDKPRMNLRTPKLKKGCLLRLPPKKLDFIPEKVVPIPKKVDYIPEKVVSIPKKVDSVSKIVDSSVSK